MNYNEAVEECERMPEMAGMHKIIVNSSEGDYYVSYKNNNPMARCEAPLMEISVFKSINREYNKHNYRDLEKKSKKLGVLRK